ncbi:flippase [Patescibacteria group bacterium]|nr:flippase [Patescibacteria group bacterium]
MTTKAPLLQKRIAYNTGIQILSKVISTAIALIATALMTRYLGTSGFGEYTTIITFISIFAIIADLGLTLVTVQMISLPGVSEKKILDNLFALRLVSAIIFLSLGPALVWLFPYDYSIKIGVLILSLSFLFIALNQILVGLFQKKLRMDKAAISEIGGRLFLILGVWLAIQFNLGLKGILWTTVVANLINFLLHFIFSRNFIRISLRFDLNIWKEIAIKSWPLAIIIVFNLIYLKADILILSLVKPQAHVGIYGAAYKVIDVLVTVPFMFAGLVLPFFTKTWALKKDLQFKKLIQKGYDFMLLLALPVLIATQFLAPEIIHLVGGSDFKESVEVLKILILAGALIFIGTLFSHVIISIDKQKKLIPIYIFTSVTSVIGYILFIPKYSYIGAAWMTVYSEAVIAIMAIYYVYRFVNFIPKQKVFLKSLLASAVMLAPILIIPTAFKYTWYGLVTTILIAVAIYFLSFYLLKGWSKKDVEFLNEIN